jgi:RNA polymerase sigma factor (sigma-70 family)
MIEARPSGDTLVARAAVAFADFRDGDRPAFDDLMKMVTPLLWHTARGQGLERVTAEDVLQTVWLSLLRHADAVRDPRTVVKWLLITTRRESWRMRQRERDGHLVREPLDGPTGTTGAWDRPADPGAEPESLFLLGQRQQRLWQHVQQLPPRCRELMRVIAFADRPDYAQIADALGMPVGSIGPTRGRCLAKLHESLEHDPAWEA